MVEILRLFSRLFFLASALHAAPWLGATSYIYVRLLLVFIPVTPLPHYTILSAQRVGPLRFVGINKQFHFRNVSKSVFRRGIELVLIDQVNARASEKIQLHPLSWYDTCLSQSHLNRFRTPRFEGQTTMWKLVCEHYLCVATHGFCHKAHKIGVASRSQRPLRRWAHYRTTVHGITCAASLIFGREITWD